MREAPVSIQRAMMCRNALVSLLATSMVIALAGYIPYSLYFLVCTYMLMIYVHVLSATAKRLNALRQSTRIATTYTSSVERFVANIVIIGLLLFAVLVFALHWLSNFSSGPLLGAFYPGLIVLSALVSLFFYVAQLPKVMANPHSQAIFG